MLSVSIPDEKGESELINTTLVAFEARSPLEVGGVVVWRKNTIEIFGETFRAFKLSKSFSFNKNTRLEVKLDNANDAQMTGVCIYETLESVNNMKQCVHLPTELGQVDVNVGFLLNDRRANIEFIAFIQANPALLEYGTSLSEIAFVQGENTDIIDENGQCKDPNASMHQRRLKMVISLVFVTVTTCPPVAAMNKDSSTRVYHVSPRHIVSLKEIIAQ